MSLRVVYRCRSCFTKPRWPQNCPMCRYAIAAGYYDEAKIRPAWECTCGFVSNVDAVIARHACEASP